MNMKGNGLTGFKLLALAAALAASASGQLGLPPILLDATEGSFYFETYSPGTGWSPYHSSLPLLTASRLNLASWMVYTMP